MSERINETIVGLLADLELHKLSASDWAVRCLEKGFDSPSVKMLASMHSPMYAPSEIDQKLNSALAELGWLSIPRRVALMQYAQQLANAVLRGAANVRVAAREIYQILAAIDAHAELGLWYEIEDMAWDAEHYEKTGEKGYYFREESELVREIKRACADFLKRTDNSLLPLPDTTFDDAETAFSRFLGSLGENAELLWVFREDVLMDGMKVFIHTPLPEDNREVTRQYFDKGKNRNLGIAFHAAYSMHGKSCCYIQLPEDDLDAQYRLMGPHDLKLSSRTNMREAEAVESSAKWWIKRVFVNKMYTDIWLRDIPTRKDIELAE